jgi:CMP/dCMP kinase
VSDAIRRPEVSAAASKASAVPAVRRVLVEQQRRMGAAGNVVMEGRDIGTVVFPNAEVKVFLDADPQVRAARRIRELEEKGQAAPAGQVAAEIRERDHRDSTRADSPLVCAASATRLDTTALSLEQVESAILEIIGQRQSARS